MPKKNDGMKRPYQAKTTLDKLEAFQKLSDSRKKKKKVAKKKAKK
jgi:hypothetical protein